MNQFTRYEKKHIRKSHPTPHGVLLAKDPKTAGNTLWVQLEKTREDYRYWKETLKELNHTLINLKASKTRHYLAKREQTIPYCEYDLDTINQKLFWWRNYYPKALDCYQDAKRYYIEAQTYYLRYTEAQKADRVNAKDFKGKYCYRISLKHGDNWNFVYYVRSNTDYLDENNFKDEFEYELELAVERFGDKLKEYSWNANWELNNILKFYRDGDIQVTIDKVPEAECEKILIDFEEFHAYRRKTILKEKERMTWDEYVYYKKSNGGENACKGFKQWLIENIGDQLEKQYYGHSAEDVITLGLTKTVHYWNRFYNMWEKGESPKSRRKDKCSK